MVLLVTLSSVTSAQEVRVRVTAPPHGAEVPERPFIEGTVSHPKAVVWVIVHPMAVSDYWVHPATHVSEDGRWKVRSTSVVREASTLGNAFRSWPSQILSNH